MREGRLAAILLLYLLIAIPVHAQARKHENWWDHIQFSPLHGDLGARNEDRSFTKNKQDETLESDQRTVTQFLNLRERLTLYDARFLEIDLGGGIETGQGYKDLEGSRNKFTRYEIVTKFLKTHPYSIIHVLRRSQGEYEHSPTSVFELDQRENTTNLILRKDSKGGGFPLPMSLSYSKKSVESGNIFEYLDRDGLGSYQFSESSETTIFRTGLSKNGTYGDFNFTNKAVERLEVSDDGIAELDYIDNDLYLNGGGTVGAKDHFRWRFNTSATDRSRWPKYQRATANQNNQWRLVDRYTTSLDALFGVGISKDKRWINEEGGSGGIAETNSKRGSVGLEHRLFRSLFTNITQSEERANQQNSERETATTSFRSRYQKRIPLGNVYGNYAQHRRTETLTGDITNLVRDEFLQLTGFEPVTLGATNINLKSVTVTNISGLTIYQVDLDFRLYQIAGETFLERVPGTRILNGETVLVDYTYVTQGGETVEEQRQYTVGTKWFFMEPYYKTTRKSQQAITGDNGTLNPGRSTTYGLKLRQTLWDRITPQATAERETNARRFDAYKRFLRSASLDVRFTYGFKIIAHTKQEELDFLEAETDINRTRRGLDAYLDTGRLALTVGASNEDNQIGDNQWHIEVARANMQLSYGKWVVTTTVRAAQEDYYKLDTPDSKYDRTSYMGKIGLKRTF